MIERENALHITRERVPGITPVERQNWKIQHKWNYSQPFERKTFKELKVTHPNGAIQNNHFVLDDGEKRRIFDDRGFEIRRETYRRIRQDKIPHHFDTTYWEESTYDDAGYLIGVVAMTFGLFNLDAPGFTRTIEYESSNGVRIPNKIITQPVDRQGVMEIGMPMGDATEIDLSDTPLLPPSGSRLYSEKL